MEFDLKNIDELLKLIGMIGGTLNEIEVPVEEVSESDSEEFVCACGNEECKYGYSDDSTTSSSWAMVTDVPDVGTNPITMSREDFVELITMAQQHAEELKPVTEAIESFGGDIDSLYMIIDKIVYYLENTMQTDLVTYWLYEDWSAWIGDAGDLYDFILAHQGLDVDYDHHIEQYQNSLKCC